MRYLVWPVIGILLMVVWLVSFIVFHITTMFIHLLLVFAILSILIHLVSDRRTHA